MDHDSFPDIVCLHNNCFYSSVAIAPTQIPGKISMIPDTQPTIVEGIKVYPVPVQTPPVTDSVIQLYSLSVTPEFLDMLNGIFVNQKASCTPTLGNLIINTLADILPHLIPKQSGCPAEVKDMAKRLLIHLKSTVDRMNRLSKQFWPAIVALAAALGGGNVELKAYALAPDSRQATLWVSWYDEEIQKTREIMIMLIERPRMPTIVPLGEVEAYGSITDSALRFFLNCIQYNPATGEFHGRLFLSDSAATLLKGLIPFQRLTLAAAARIWPALKQFGDCLTEVIEADATYQAWKNSNPNSSEFSLGFADQETAVAAAKSVAFTTVFFIVVKVAIAAGTEQWWIIAVPAP